MTTSFKQISLTGARAAALCLLALAAVLLQGREARAQWTQPDSAGNTSATGTGNVGIGTATPAYPVTIIKDLPSDPTMFAAFNRADGQGAQAAVGVSRTLDWSNKYLSFGVTAPAFAVPNLNDTAYIHSKGMPLKFGSESANDISFFTNGVANTRMTIAGTGNVGVGTSAPLGVFDVTTTGVANGGGIDFVVKDSVMANSNPLVFSHKVGTSSGALTRIGFNVYSNSTSFAVVNSSAGGLAIQSDTRNGITAPTLQFSSFTNAPVKTDVMTLTQDGNMGLGTTAPVSRLHVAGNITVDGNINAKYQDVAEWVPSTQKLQAGTVVVLDKRHANHVSASTIAYDTRVAGVVSAQPGLTLGEAGEGKALVATTGRVKVKVDATRAPIEIGDLIVTSDVEGVAMKSEPISLGGRHMHAPGTIIGKALESLEKGKGEILVLLSLQ